MKWTELIRAVAERTSLDDETVRNVLNSMSAIVSEQVVAGEDVTLRGLGAIGSAWRGERRMRSVTDYRMIRLDGRFVPRFRPSDALRRALGGRTPQTKRTPEHQEAWRVAETLVADLDLYHNADAPRDLAPGTNSETVHVACQIAFGNLWYQVVHAYESEVPESIRSEHDYLAEAALALWQQR